MRVAPALGIIFAIVAVGVPSCIAVRSRDLPPLDDSDLLRESAQTPASEAGLLELERAAAKLRFPRERDFVAHVASVLEDGEDPNARLLEVLGRNREGLAEAHAALAGARFDVPLRSMEGGYPEWFDLATLLAIEGIQQARSGQAAASLRSCIDTIELGNRISNAKGSDFPGAVTGLATEHRGARAMQRSLKQVDVDASEARALADRLGAYQTDQELWSRFWAEEYRFRKAALATDLSGDDLNPRGKFAPLLIVLGGYTFQMNRTLGRFADHYREAQQDSRRPCAQLAHAGRRPAWIRKLEMLDRNGTGNLLFDVSYMDPRIVHGVRCMRDTALAATQAHLALRAYQRDHGELPEVLDTLVPRYLAALPLDAFDARPLRYAPRRRLVYSTGMDGIDRGGELRAGEDSMLEIAFPLQFEP